MSPLIFITGVILASAASISLGLLVTLFVVMVLGDEFPRLASELRPLLASSAVFAIMTAISALSFLGLVRRRRWRWYAQASMWLALVGVILYFLPR